jgi:hypothetical protein
MAFVTDKEVKEAIKRVLLSGFGEGEGPKVVTRWKLALDQKDWKGALKSLGDTKKINGWLITRIGRRSKQVTTFKYEYTWKYALIHFRSLADNGPEDNSEDALNEDIENIASQFECSFDLGFGEDNGVDSHDQLQVLNIDVVDDQVHLVQCELVVKLTKQA